jgi:hypothetical protein
MWLRVCPHDLDAATVAVAASSAKAFFARQRRVGLPHWMTFCSIGGVREFLKQRGRCRCVKV